MFRAEAAEHGIELPTIVVLYSVMDHDTISYAYPSGPIWVVRVNVFADQEAIETILYYELTHVACMHSCNLAHVANYGKTSPLTDERKERLFQQIRQFKRLCHK